MSYDQIKSGTPSTQGQGAAATANNELLLLDKLHARTCTPDSEALASPDDEGDHRQESTQPAIQSASQIAKPVRRPSWLNETSRTLGHPRKESFISSSMSPTASQLRTPSAETGAGVWGSHSAASVIARTGALPWGPEIWRAEPRDPAARPSEAVPSLTSTIPPGAASNSFFNPDTQTSPVSRDSRPNSQIPPAIPHQPVPKTYRSQLYSVGQSDPKITAVPPVMSSSAILGYARRPALQPRFSRLSMLSEIANDGIMLGKSKKVKDDDDKSPGESPQRSFYRSSDAKTIGLLAQENAILRQQTQYNARTRPRVVTRSAYIRNGYSLRGSVPEEYGFAIDDLDEANESAYIMDKRALNWRMSQFGQGSLHVPFGIDSRKADNANPKEWFWPTFPGFPITEVPHCQRHPFANTPTRQGSTSSIPNLTSTLERSATEMQQPQKYPPVYHDASSFGAAAHDEWEGITYSCASDHLPFITASQYFGGAVNVGNAYRPGFPSQYPFAYGLPNPDANCATFPPHNKDSIAQPRHNGLLYIVLFKCARADVFYIQEGTGLTVRPGDFVIVEADRGTDLGTVAKDNIDWQTAKDLKEYYTEEHYKWFMIYSQGAAAALEVASDGHLASSIDLQARAVGGMASPSQHHTRKSSESILRPRLIKRLAQSHEVHALRDKEGLEAKAKRVCMQKVKEHGLRMEILDAEFQMDWRKLTFYYFANSYVNFNSLVTDLFKIYKMRIWMSDITPVSFASPTLAVQTPSCMGPGGVGAAGGSDDLWN